MGRGPESLPGFKLKSFTFIYFMKKVLGEILSPTLVPLNIFYK